MEEDHSVMPIFEIHAVIDSDDGKHFLNGKNCNKNGSIGNCLPFVSKENGIMGRIIQDFEEF